MIKKLGNFKINSNDKTSEIPFTSLKEGINDCGNHIIRLKNGIIDFVIDKICDHAGGRIIIKGNHGICPMHNWKLDLSNLKYNDSHVCKAKKEFSINDGIIVIKDVDKTLSNPFKLNLTNGKVNFRWLNHATIYLEVDGFSLITDPWLFGPAFMTGWWLSEPSPSDCVELLKKVDIIYISHNHPDHLHPETLSCIDKNKQFIVGNFHTKSTEKYLNKLGYENILPLNFNEIYELSNNMQVSILKSGDFRDDSGIYLNINNVELLLTVDSNFLNHNILPKNIDILMTSFAGGASGFPLCFEDYNEDEKNQIIKRNRNSIIYNVSNYLKVTSPKYYMPYAGMFKEYSYRDSYISENNIKNSFDKYKVLCENNNISFIKPASNVLFEIDKNELRIYGLEINYFEKENTRYYIDKLKDEYKLEFNKVLKYFSNSGFRDHMLLQIIPTDDNFKAISNNFFYIDFQKSIFEIKEVKHLEIELEKIQVTTLRIRVEILMCVIENYLPWEDISIGFQMRVNRKPNKYESNFWYYFTNEYIAKENFRYSSFCGACTVINQNPIWNKQT